MPIDRRTLLAAGAGALVASHARADTNDDYFRDLYEKAKKEGEVTWYIAHWSTEVAELVAKGFAEKYPGIKPSVVRATGNVIYQRLSQDMKAKVANCDVFASGDPGHALSLKKMNALTQY
jgi:iron(III) transport system substrate-binding protein